MHKLESQAGAETPSPSGSDPRRAAGNWREHDLLVRRFHNGSLVPTEIAVVLNNKGLRVKTWAVTEAFVRIRLKALGLMPNISRVLYSRDENLYLPRPRFHQA
ncbi:MAG TPA: hypothetical protein VGB82_25965 [Alphaproteobacteria bacterium]